MDIFDQASEMEEKERERSIANARKPVKKLYPAGFCHYCSERVDAGALFCDIDCSEGWQEEEDARKRNGG